MRGAKERRFVPKTQPPMVSEAGNVLLELAALGGPGDPSLLG